MPGTCEKGTPGHRTASVLCKTREVILPLCTALIKPPLTHTASSSDTALQQAMEQMKRRQYTAKDTTRA